MSKNRADHFCIKPIGSIGASKCLKRLAPGCSWHYSNVECLHWNETPEERGKDKRVMETGAYFLSPNIGGGRRVFPAKRICCYS